MTAEALESAIRYVQGKLLAELAESDDKTDGTVKKCVQDTDRSPEEYPQAWEVAL